MKRRTFLQSAMMVGGTGNAAAIEPPPSEKSQLVKAAAPTDGTNSLSVAIWDSGATRTMRQRGRDRYCILDAPGQPDPRGRNDSTASLRAMIAEGIECELTDGSFVQTEEIELTTRNQLIRGQGMGHGYGNGGLADFVPRSRIIVAGTGNKRIRTRRLWRGSASSPQDAPISVAWNVQAAGVQLQDLCLWLDCDYSDPSPTNLGDDWDVLLFSGTRMAMQLRNVALLGYARQAALMIDVTQGAKMSRFPDLNGVPYPREYVEHGSDGIHLWNPYIRGGRRGLAILGAKPEPGAATYKDRYYDMVSGQLETDNRGGFGCSDFNVFGGAIFGPEHHSGRRLKDPVLDGGVLSLDGMMNEPDDAPAAVHIDGLSGNGAKALWGMRFFGSRINTREAFRVRLDRAARVFFYSAHSDIASGKTATGADLTTTDYDTQSYGDIAATPNTLRVGWHGTVQTGRKGLAPHYYGADLSFHTDQGTISTDRYVQATQGVRSDTGDFDIRAGAGYQVKVRHGGSVLMTAAPTLASFSQPVCLPNFTVATLPTPMLGSGTIIHVTNAPDGPVLAYSDGSDWRRVSDRSVL